jgi:hypothetical protein
LVAVAVRRYDQVAGDCRGGGGAKVGADDVQAGVDRGRGAG